MSGIKIHNWINESPEDKCCTCGWGCWNHVSEGTSACKEKWRRHFHEEYKKELFSQPLLLQGKATDHIWTMEDIDGYIGLRMDCGDSGTVYLTKQQAKQVIENLEAHL